MSQNAEATRVLFVDDEEGIRITLAAVLERHGFDVTAVAAVGDALTQINCMRFDVLLCDLNIEKPGDGFAVIGAMRHVQPNCVSFVLTGYPAFENALQALQHQVDDFFTKPADLDTLVKKINEKLEARRSKVPVPFKTLTGVLRENCADIVARVSVAAQNDPIMTAVRSGQYEADNLSKIMDALIEYVEVGRNGLKSEALTLGAEHGRRRKREGYDARMIVREFQLVDERICDLMASDRMPAAPVGLTSDLAKLTKGLNAFAIAALKPYIKAGQASRV
jgi:ActR/RegA family two-component response regulator